MTCFKCNTYLYKKKIEGVPVQECPGCRGIWIEDTHLEKLQQRLSFDPRLREAKGKPTSYNCKKCEGSIHEVSVNSKEGSVQLDHCTSCHGTWFDHGELEKVQNFCSSVDMVFSEKTINKLKQRTVWKEKLSRVYYTEEPVSKTTVHVRNQFVAKVYKLFAYSLLAGGVGAGIGIGVELTYTYYWELAILEFLVLFGVIAVRRNKNWNLPALFIFTTLTGLITSPFLNMFIKSGNGHLIALALALTVGIFGVLSWYVHKTKNDFSFMGGFLFSALLILFYAGFIGIFCPGTMSWLIYSCLGLLLFCGFVLFDTSRIILKYNVEEYVAATLDLYLDFINIFADILRILFETADVSDFFP